MTASSPASRPDCLGLGIDIVFGVVPALMFGWLSSVGVVGGVLAAMKSGISGLGRDAVGPFTLGLLGMLACLFLIFAIVTRGRVKPRYLPSVLLFLVVGAVFASIMTFLYFAETLPTWGDSSSGVLFDKLVFVVALAIDLIALKYIVILTLRRSS